MTSVRINVSTAQGFTPTKCKDVIIVVTEKGQFAALSADSDAVKAAELSAENLAVMKGAVESRLSPSKDSGASVELLFPVDHDFRRFVVCVLPTGFSRNTSPSRSHSVTSLVKTNKGSSDVLIIIAPTDGKMAFAQACAAARPFNEYSLKSGGATGKEKVVDIVLAMPTPTAADDVLATRTSHVIDGIRLAQRLVDAPPNILHTDAYVEEVRRAVDGIDGVTLDVIQGQRLEEEGFGGLWGVGKASEHLPALVVMTYTPSSMAGATHLMKAPICIVGKGIVYDTGGLSIKTPTTSMAGMKTDMGGSAAVVGAFIALARSGVDCVIHGLLCIAENSVGPLATRPDDVHTLLSGKTVEVNNTDAEGRLVLADGCFYSASKLGAGIIFDIATLTGAQLISTGKNHAALFCSHEELELLGVKVGKETGDLTYPLLYAPEFHKPEFRSQVRYFVSYVP
jgi:probable aminopeptidase NPEPL1